MTSGHNDGPALRGKPSRVQGGQEVAEGVACRARTGGRRTQDRRSPARQRIREPPPTSARTTVPTASKPVRRRFSADRRRPLRRPGRRRSPRSAPRDSASIPVAPVPANRSRTRRPATRRPEAGEQPLAGRVGHRPRAGGHRAEPDPLGGPAMTRTAASLAIDGAPRYEWNSQSIEPLRTGHRSSASSSGWPSSSGSSSISANARARARRTRSSVLGQPGELQVGHPRLPDVEQRALAPQAQILVGELEPVGRARPSRPAAPGPRRSSAFALVEQDAVRRDARPGRSGRGAGAAARGRSARRSRRASRSRSARRRRPRSPSSRSARRRRPRGTAPCARPSPPGASARAAASTVEVGEDLGREALGLGLGGPHLRAVALVDRGAHHERLAAGARPRRAPAS